MIIDLNDGTSYNTHRDEITCSTETDPQPPRYLWRTLRAEGTVNHYGNVKRRNTAARKMADIDQLPVTPQHWTPEQGWHNDLAGTGDESFRVGDQHHVEGLGWVTDDGLVHAACKCVSGIRRQYRCGIVPVVAGTGFCLTHQHVYRRENGIPEPEREPAPEPEPDPEFPLITEVLSDAEQQAMASASQAAGNGYRVRVTVDFPPEGIAEGSEFFAWQLGTWVAGRRIPGITYWATEEGSTVYAVTYSPADDVPDDGPTVTVNLQIENGYELYEEVTSYVHGAVIPAPPDDDDEYDEWEHEHVLDWAGIGHTRGNSWYTVQITGSSDPALVGRVFES